MKKYKFLLWGLPILVFVGVMAWLLMSSPKKTSEVQLTVPVKKGLFRVTVTATGGLQAIKSEMINGPEAEMRSAGIWQTSIQDIIQEGTVVNEGDYVAQLDKTVVSDKIQTVRLDIDQIEARLTQARLDTALEMRAMRDQIINLGFQMREKELEMEQSRYEPPAVINRVKLDLERIQRDFIQQQQNYKLKQEQAVAKIAEINASLQQKQTAFDRLVQLGDKFRIKAPKGGMLIYYFGRKAGAQIGAWDPVVAELPDLSKMLSKTNINEVDISKIKKGQTANIRIDAFPDKSFTGKITQVANVGQQLPGFDAKVFEILIELSEADSILRPAMTTSNEVLVAEYPDVHYVPLEALFSNDTLTWVVCQKDGKNYRQEVLTGPTNDNEVIIEHGVSEGVQVYISTPPDMDKMPIERIPQNIKDEFRQKQIEEALRQKSEEAAKRKAMEEALQKLD